MSALAKHENHNVVPAQQTSGLLGVIERIAGNPDVDIERMQALLKMRADEEERLRRIDREDRDEMARREWLSAFSQVQSEVGPIIRSNYNDHTKSSYASLADIERVVTPILTKYGFSTTATPIACDLKDHIRMRLTIGHGGGHEKSYEDDFALDSAGAAGRVNKTAIQAKGSTQTYARRYLKASALDLAFMDDRDGNAAPVVVEPITKSQVEIVLDMISKGEVDIEKFCGKWQINAVSDLTQNRFDEVVMSLNGRINWLANQKATAGGAA